MLVGNPVEKGRFWLCDLLRASKIGKLEQVLYALQPLRILTTHKIYRSER